MAYAMIILAMVLVIGPVFWLRPSKRERKLMALRQVAMATGAKIQPLNIHQDSFFSQVLLRNPHLDEYRWVRYQWFAEEKQSGPALKETWLQRKDAQQGLLWEPQKVTTKEPANVSELILPWRDQQQVRFLALELGPRNVAVVWNEEGTEAEIAALAGQVKQLLQTA